MYNKAENGKNPNKVQNRPQKNFDRPFGHVGELPL